MMLAATLAVASPGKERYILAHQHATLEESRTNSTMQRSTLTRYAWLSIGAALTTIALKSAAYFMTGSVGLLSDAAESLVNLAGACMALVMLVIAAKPPDENHHYGHTKAEYFASGAEGMLILIAAVGIGYAAINRLFNLQPLDQLGPGLIVSAISALINLFTARILLRVGRAEESITLEADGHHLMTDVWTSIGVIVGIGLVGLTGWSLLDPLIALLVTLNICRTGVDLVSRSIQGLMDTALPESDHQCIEAILARYREQGIAFHAVKSRQSAGQRFLSMHVLVPGEWATRRSHDLVQEIESAIRQELTGIRVFTHLEPLEDPLSFPGSPSDVPDNHH
jgi:cation diffusion facilitator family transporter